MPGLQASRLDYSIFLLLVGFQTSCRVLHLREELYNLGTRQLAVFCVGGAEAEVLFTISYLKILVPLAVE